jgi:hypothetical protein
VTDQETTTLLYALSTLAQTCAALSAFVGAVGIFYLQMLRDRRRDAERNLRDLARSWMGEGAIAESLDEVLNTLSRMADAPHPNLAPANQARSACEAFGRRLRRSQPWLVVFEAWNLLVIAASLIGFNCVPSLASWRFTPWALGVAAVGTVTVTVGCVVARTRE